MRIYRGQCMEKVFPSMGCTTFYNTGDMACSSPEGVTKGLVCDADIYGVKTPAKYLRTFFEGCSHSHEIVDAVTKIYEINGSYAGAFNHEGEVYIFRDVLGVKPLYYQGETFASERKVLLNPLPLLPGELRKLPSTRLFRKQLHQVITQDPQQILDALTKNVHQVTEKDAAVLFSGGIDSSILAALSDAPLFTCGLEGSQDILFSRKAARLLKKEYIELVISEKDVREAIPRVLSIIEDKTLMNLELGLLIYFVCKTGDKKILISGQGADELFGGYYKYEKAFNQKKDVKALMRKDLDTICYGLERDGQVAERFSTLIRYPYLDPCVVQRGLGIPVHSLFTPQRKGFLRKVASLLFLPDEIVSRPKKALQYGSGIHKIVKKIIC
ncbi:MAG: asparagine synthetase B [Theionarchaea archaeon]|nr:asparagine synthetase B [Theionarchaea archaeon]